MEAGCIVERGSRGELLERGAVYARMWAPGDKSSSDARVPAKGAGRPLAVKGKGTPGRLRVRVNHEKNFLVFDLAAFGQERTLVLLRP